MSIMVPLIRDSQIALVAVAIFFGTVATGAVGLRLLAAHMSSRRLDASDYSIMVAWLLTMGLMVTCILEAVLGGFGWHYREITMEFGPWPIVQYHKILLPLEMLWTLSLTTTKLSVLLFYTRVFAVTSVKLWARITMVLVALLGCSGVMSSLLICQPIQYNWNLSLPGGHCGSQSAVFAVFGIMNLVTDVAVLAMPIPNLMGLKLPLVPKASLLATFFVGFLTCIASIVRLVYLSKINYDDVTYTSVTAVLMSAVEPSLAVMLACVPLLRPLLGSSQSRRAATSRLSDKSEGIISNWISNGWSKSKTLASTAKTRRSIIRLASSDAELGVSRASVRASRSTHVSRYDSDVEGMELRYVLSPGEDVSHHAHVEALPSRHSTLSIADMTMLQQAVDSGGAKSGMTGIGSGIVVKQEWAVESEPR